MTLHVLHRDIEGYGPLDLRVVGAHRWAADPRSGIYCVAYAVDDGPPQLWVPPDPVPPEYFEAANNADWAVAAHNDPYESTVERYKLYPQYGFPLIPPERHVCTQAAALALGLPAKLGRLADVLELANRKDAAGEKLMLQMARPRKRRKDEIAEGLLYFDDPERRARLGKYCCQDMEVEREIYNVLRALSASEHALRVLSSRINDRGFHVDRNFAEAARRIAQAAAPEINAELAEITGGDVTSIAQIAKLQIWLQQQGCTAKKLDKKAIEKLLLDAELLPPPVRRVLELRQGGAQAAVKKIDALLARAGDGDRIRGAFRYHGAATGRWAGQGYQPQNLKRLTVKDEGLDAAIAAVATGDYEHVRARYERPLAIVGECSRPTICAASGHALIGGDFSSVESRALAWTAREEWKLESYRRFDETHDPRDEPYCITACKIFRVPDGSFMKESPERGVGKICDLAFGYMGALGAWRKFEPEKFTDEEVEKFKSEWRAAHPKIVELWHALDRAAWTAVRERGRVVQCGCVAFKCSGAFLFLRLPSGRKISYPNPRIKIISPREQVVIFSDNAAGQFTDCRHGHGAYGGTWTENVVSGISRDLLVEAMQRIEAAGYPIVLHCHDEIVAEVPEGLANTEEFTHLMTQVPSWASGLPIAAGVWSGPRYCK